MIPLTQRLGQSGLATPPDTPHKRRRFLRASEETSGEMSLETYLYNSDGYRCSSFKSPWPLPLVIEDPEPDLHINGQKMNSLMPKIRSILETNYMEKNVIRLQTALVSKLDYPGGEKRTLALIIHMNQVTPSTASWADARDELRTFLTAQGLENMQIEIFDRKRAFMPWLLPLKPDSSAVRTYEVKRKYLLPVVKDSMKDDWVAMSLFKLGLRSDPIKPALVVLVRPGAFRDWSEISRKLRTILSDVEISIEFLPGNTSHLGGMSLQSRLTRYPQIGSSIGEHKEIGAGTLGGHVILEKDGIKHYGMLTNHHVVMPLSAAKDTIQAFNRYGYGSTHPHFETLMQYPALEDHQASVKKIEALVSEQKQVVKEIQETLERFEMKGQEPPERQLERLSMTENELKELRQQKELIDKLPVILGKVLYSSGQAISPRKSILDWAFIETYDVKNFSRQSNKLPNANVAGLEGKLSDFFELPGPRYNADDDHPRYARYFATMEKGKWYFKKGRSSGITAGICHGTEIEVARQGQVRWNERGEQITLGKTSTSELVIFGKLRLGWEEDIKLDIPETFSMEGDSGSFVFNTYGEVAGLLYGTFTFAGTDNRLRMNSGLVTSMDEVLDSIRSKTGGVLSLP